MERIDPENAPGFLVGRVAHRLKVNVRKFLTEAGIKLTAEEISILTVLAHLDSDRNMGSLAELLGRDPTTLKRQLSGLVKAGLLNRKTSVKDRRVVNISITAEGKALVQSTLPMTFALRDRAMKGISKSDRQTLVKTLLKMLKNLKTEEDH